MGNARKTLRRQAWIVTFLVALVLIKGVQMGVRHLSTRHDLSEDQLFAISPGTHSILGKLEDRLQVKAFVTQDVRSGEWALVKARIEAQIKELQRIAGPRMGLTLQDPSVLSAAQEEAHSFGIEPRPVVTMSGGAENRQLVYLGAVLRYKSRTEVLPLLNPWSLEVDFAGAVQRLLRDQKLRLGWTGEPLEPNVERSAYGLFSGIRARLERRMDVVEIPSASLEAGTSIPANVDILLVVRPVSWHPRAVFALDQFVQRGGRAMILIDPVFNHPWDLAEHRAAGKELPRTGLEPLLQAWGAPLARGQVWDCEWPGMRAVLVADLDANGNPTQQGRLDPIPDPSCPNLKPDAFSRTFPPTGRTAGVQFFWAQAFGGGDVPPGLERQDVIHSSESSYLIPPVEQVRGSVDEIEGQTRSLLASGSGMRHPLATVLTGRFPSPFDRGAPEPLDATAGEPTFPVPTTGEPVLSGQSGGQVVLVGDADWVRDPLPGDLAPVLPSFSGPNLRLFESLIDWLARDEDLIAVRGKEPRDRPLRNILEEELREEGLLGVGMARTQAEMRDRSERRDAAESRATRKRWRAMLWPLLLALGIAFGAAGLWRYKERAKA